MAMKPNSKFERMDASGMERMPKISDGSQAPIVGKPVPSKQGKPQGVYRPKRDGAKVPAKGFGIPPRNPFANKPSSMMQQNSAESIKKRAMIADVTRSQKNARINAMKKMVGG